MFHIFWVEVPSAPVTGFILFFSECDEFLGFLIITAIERAYVTVITNPCTRYENII